MNPAQMLINQLQNQLKSKNPKAFQQFEQMRNSGNPQDFLNQITNQYTPEQREKFIQYAKGFGVSEEQLKKYGINS